MPSFCPGCGTAGFDRVYACRGTAAANYCFTCGTNWYMRDVGTRSNGGLDFLMGEMLPLPAGEQLRTRGGPFDRPEPTTMSVDYVAWVLSDGRIDNWTATLVRLIARADAPNRDKLEKAFPLEVATFRKWAATPFGQIPRAAERVQEGPDDVR